MATQYYSPSGIYAPSSTAEPVTDQSIALGQKQYRQLPGYDTSLANIGNTIGAETRGELPADVIRQIQQQAAERGISTGTAGSQNNNAGYLRALGLNSLDMTNLGQANFGRALPLLPGLSQNPAFYTTPGTNLQANIADANLSNEKYQFSEALSANERALREAKAGITAGMSAGAGAGTGMRGSPIRGTDALGFSGNATWGPGQGSVFGNSLGGATTIGGEYYYPGQALPGATSPVDQIIRNYSPEATGSGAQFRNDEDYYGWEGGGGGGGGTAASATAPAGTSSGYYYAGADPADSGGDDDWYNAFDYSDYE